MASIIVYFCDEKKESVILHNVEKVIDNQDGSITVTNLFRGADQRLEDVVLVSLNPAPKEESEETQ